MGYIFTSKIEPGSFWLKIPWVMRARARENFAYMRVRVRVIKQMFVITHYENVTLEFGVTFSFVFNMLKFYQAICNEKPYKG